MKKYIISTMVLSLCVLTDPVYSGNLELYFNCFLNAPPPTWREIEADLEKILSLIDEKDKPWAQTKLCKFFKKKCEGDGNIVNCVTPFLRENAAFSTAFLLNNIPILGEVKKFFDHYDLKGRLYLSALHAFYKIETEMRRQTIGRLLNRLEFAPPGKWGDDGKIVKYVERIITRFSDFSSDTDVEEMINTVLPPSNDKTPIRDFLAKMDTLSSSRKRDRGNDSAPDTPTPPKALRSAPLSETATQ